MAICRRSLLACQAPPPLASCPILKGVTIAIEPRVVGLEVAAGMYGISADQITGLQRADGFPFVAHRPISLPRTSRPGRRLVRRRVRHEVECDGPLTAWVPWAATALFLAAVTACWAWARVINHKRHRRFDPRANPVTILDDIYDVALSRRPIRIPGPPWGVIDPPTTSCRLARGTSSDGCEALAYRHRGQQHHAGPPTRRSTRSAYARLCVDHGRPRSRAGGRPRPADRRCAVSFAAWGLAFIVFELVFGTIVGKGAQAPGPERHAATYGRRPPAQRRGRDEATPSTTCGYCPPVRPRVDGTPSASKPARSSGR